MKRTQLPLILLFSLLLAACGQKERDPGRDRPNRNTNTTSINATIGVACTDNTPCGTEGTCTSQQADGTYSGGYCTADCSDSTKSCPTGSTCQTIDSQKRCMLTCSDDNGCRSPGYTCDTSLHVCVTKPAGITPSTTPINATIGVACTDNTPCGTEGTCTTQKADGTYSGGYCTADCSDPTKSCPTGSTCQTIDGQKQCMLTCSDDNGCRTPGYTCDTSLHVCVTKPAGITPSTTPINATIGVACTDSTPCGTEGTCIFQNADGTYSGGYCTADCSDSTKSCPTGSTCQTINGQKQCMLTCSDDNGCRSPEYTCDTSLHVCVTKPAVLDVKVGETCNGTYRECGSDGHCANNIGGERYPAGYCSANCSSSEVECPSGSSCQVVGSLSLCLKSCLSATECRESDGYTCDMAKHICVPKTSAALTADIPTTTCTDDNSCSGGQKCLELPDSGYPVAQGIWEGVKLCTADCTHDATICPSNSICQTMGNRKFCLPKCTADCTGLPGLTCGEYEGATDKTCHPKKLPGEACATDSECAAIQLSDPTDFQTFFQPGICFNPDPGGSGQGRCELTCDISLNDPCPTGTICDGTIPNHFICRKACNDVSTCGGTSGEFECKEAIRPDNDVYEKVTDAGNVPQKVCYPKIKSSTSKKIGATCTPDALSCGPNGYCTFDQVRFQWYDDATQKYYMTSKNYCSVYSYGNDACPDGSERLAVQKNISTLTRGVVPSWLDNWATIYPTDDAYSKELAKLAQQLGVCLITCDTPGNDPKCPTDFECATINSKNYCIPSMSIQKAK